MATTVIILGAGASREAGAPLMGDFLDVAHAVRHSGRLDPATTLHFDRVFNTIGRLQPVHSKCAALDLVNIESVFATLEVAKLLRKLPGLLPSEIADAIESLKILIVRTLEMTIGFPVTKAGAVGPPTYSKFSLLVRHLTEVATPRHSVALITFNYDIALDAALVQSGISPDYALDSALASGQKPVPVLKLHGSLNWAECKEGHVACWDISSAMAVSRRMPLTENLFGSLVGSDIHRFQHCGQAVRNLPVIVPPTWNKGALSRGDRGGLGTGCDGVGGRGKRFCDRLFPATF